MTEQASCLRSKRSAVQIGAGAPSKYPSPGTPYSAINNLAEYCPDSARLRHLAFLRNPVDSDLQLTAEPPHAGAPR